MTDKITFAYKLNIYGHPPSTPFDVFARLARQAEDTGMDAIYVVDHLYLPPNRYAGYTWTNPDEPFFLEAWTVLAAIAQATHRIRLGPQVSPLTFRHPSMLAKMSTTVDLISNGRMVLQLGAGWHREEHEAYGFPFEEKFGPRFEALVEGVEIIRGLWESEGRFSYEGKHFTLKDAPFWPKPVQKPSPPIWFGGMGKKIRSMVAKYGDGWSPAMPQHDGLTVDTYTNGLTEIRELAAGFGRDPQAITPGLLFSTAIHENREQAADLASVLYRRADYAGLSMEDLRTRGILSWGNVDDCLRALDLYIKAGVRYFTLNFVPFADANAAMHGMELYASKILPRLG